MTKLLALCLLLVLAMGLEKYEVSYQEVVDKIRSQPDYISLVILSSSDKTCGRCQKGNRLFDQISMQLENIIQFFFIDCAKTDLTLHKSLEQACKESKILPHLTFFDQKDNTNSFKPWPKDHIYQGEVELNAMTNYIYKIMIDYVKTIETKTDWNQFFNSKQHIFKAIYITDTGELPIHIKAMASHLYHNLTVPTPSSLACRRQPSRLYPLSGLCHTLLVPVLASPPPCLMPLSNSYLPRTDAALQVCPDRL